MLVCCSFAAIHSVDLTETYSQLYRITWHQCFREWHDICTCHQTWYPDLPAFLFCKLSGSIDAEFGITTHEFMQCATVANMLASIKVIDNLRGIRFQWNRQFGISSRFLFLLSTRASSEPSYQWRVWRGGGRWELPSSHPPTPRAQRKAPVQMTPHVPLESVDFSASRAFCVPPPASYTWRWADPTFPLTSQGTSDGLHRMHNKESAVAVLVLSPDEAFRT